MQSRATEPPEPPPRGALPVNVRHDLLGAWATLVLKLLRAEACAKVDHERQDPADPPGASGDRLPAPVRPASGAQPSGVFDRATVRPLKHRAAQLGWPPDRVEVIDEDSGRAQQAPRGAAVSGVSRKRSATVASAPSLRSRTSPLAGTSSGGDRGRRRGHGRKRRARCRAVHWWRAADGCRFSR
jgi:hypothetical protein